MFFVHLAGYGQQSEVDFSIERKSDSVFLHLQQRLEESKLNRVSSRTIAQDYLVLGEYYHTLRLSSEAIGQFNQALQIIGTDSNHKLYILLNNSIGKVYLSLNNFELAEQYFTDTMKVSSELGFQNEQAESKSLLGACYEKNGQYDKALQYQEESLLLFEALNDKDGVAMTNENIGSIYEDLEKFDLAYQYFSKAYDYLRDSDSDKEINVLNNLGDVYRKTGNYESALAQTYKALNLAIRLNNRHQRESAHNDLSKTYALMGDFEQAHAQLKETDRINNDILKDRNTDQLHMFQTIYETNKKEAQIQLLKEQNKVSTAKQNLLWVALFAIAAILTILYSYLGRKRKAKIKIQEYKQRMLKAELDKKEIQEQNLQREVQLKAASLSRYSLHLSQKNKILLDLSNTLRNIVSRQNMNTHGKIKQLVKEIDINLKQENEWDEFMNFFKEIHPEFIKKLSSLSQSNLSPAELRLGMLLRLNLSSKEIATILRVTPDSVRVARYRLRKKLPIDQKEELVNFMIEL
ncbi:tetratricopeptide repeat protein [Flagellimonas sp. HMM57]|uniref:tetratricopeptide repeat protein n=1 Tax=unclassified Flagellimonas TaxID=2644544 RepID=UPI0013D1441F|nr:MULTISPECIES: tetratricopeptide repeat protein [unclassified Flagellimonas]UII74510.1 tetratricopeptide repeat protein [Flagellimonas sp. HMM57]